jgi:hypothetical protein
VIVAGAVVPGTCGSGSGVTDAVSTRDVAPSAGARGNNSSRVISDAAPSSGTGGIGVFPVFACTNFRKEELEDFRNDRSCNNCCKRKLRTVATDFATSAVAAPSLTATVATVGWADSTGDVETAFSFCAPPAVAPTDSEALADGTTDAAANTSASLDDNRSAYTVSPCDNQRLTSVLCSLSICSSVPIAVDGVDTADNGAGQANVGNVRECNTMPAQLT